jgi:hypothetical protein
VPSFNHGGLTRETTNVPARMPGTSPIRIGSRRRHIGGIAARFAHSTDALSGISSRTSAGLSVRFGSSSNASGTVIDEKPYPSAPLTSAATNAIAATAA